MKLYLASFRETQNHGPGKKIVVAGSKPDSLQVDGAFPPFIPDLEISNRYRELQVEDQDKASEYFVSNYKKQLENFFSQVRRDAKEEVKTVQEVLPFSDGDTFLTWERAGYTSYRPILAEFLKAEGYEIEAK